MYIVKVILSKWIIAHFKTIMKSVIRQRVHGRPYQFTISWLNVAAYINQLQFIVLKMHTSPLQNNI